MAVQDRSIRGVFHKDYKHMYNPLLNSCLINDFIDNSLATDPAFEANATANNNIDAYNDIPINPAIDNAETFNTANTVDVVDTVDALINSYNNKFNNSLQRQSVDLFNLVLQALFAWYTRQTC
jgi:hypothetical protein